MPLSDGGEGFVEALKKPLNLNIKTINVTGMINLPSSSLSFPFLKNNQKLT